jgi:hypothetical protein
MKLLCYLLRIKREARVASLIFTLSVTACTEATASVAAEFRPRAVGREPDA